ncbi:type 1 glutamine amidotransferase domain-containing protein [Kitasatospora sp. NPDC005856]|uniref:type 1 glutamine amidotransferase domain-containing protein n=1 Tax=Kitasatospora sp. NPDC005856 TaxID=3154566 RepID=UPI0033E07B64
MGWPSTTLTGRTIAFLVAPYGAEQVELTDPWQAVAESGGTPRLLSTAEGRVRTVRHHAEGDTFAVDALVAEADPADYDGLVLPGGVANPDRLRLDRPAVAFVRACCAAGRPVAAICHAAWTLIEADAVRGRTLTSWPSLRTDLVNAGAHWVDEPVHVCHDGPGPLVTSRKPADLPVFDDAFVTEFAHAAASGRR